MVNLILDTCDDPVDAEFVFVKEVSVFSVGLLWTDCFSEVQQV